MTWSSPCNARHRSWRVLPSLWRGFIGGAALALLCAALPAQAEEFPPPLKQDTPGLQPVAQLQHTCSSNLFGLSSAAAAQQLFGDTQRSDCWTTLQGGLRYDNQGAVGRLRGHALIDRTRYRHYSLLDFTGHDIGLNYNLDHAPQWSAYATATDSSAQQSLALLQAPLPDLVHKQVVAAGGAHRIAGPFDLTADTAWIRIRNSAGSQRPYDMDIELVRLGPRYTTAAGNSIGYAVSLLKGRYPHAAAQTGNAPLADFRQLEGALQFNWTDDAYWRLSGTAGYLRYTAPSLPALNFSGAVADMQAQFAATDKTTLGLKLYRKLVAYNTASTNYQVLTGAQFSVIWHVDAAVHLQADYTRDEALYPGSSRKDRIHGGGLTAVYLPRSGTQLALRYARTNRSSNAADASYANNTLSLSLQQAF